MNMTKAIRVIYLEGNSSNHTGEISIRVTMEIRLQCTVGHRRVNNNQEVEVVIKEDTRRFKGRESV